MLSGMRQRKARRLETGCLLEVDSKQRLSSFLLTVVRMTKPVVTFDVEKGVTKKDDEFAHHLFFVLSFIVLFWCFTFGTTHHAFHEVALECYLGMLYS